VDPTREAEGNEQELAWGRSACSAPAGSGHQQQQETLHCANPPERAQQTEQLTNAMHQRHENPEI